MRVAVVVLLLAIAQPARADDSEDARAQAAQLANDAFRRIDDAQDYAGASDLFQRAYDLSNELRYLLNVAVSLRKAPEGLPHVAVLAYRRYLAAAGPDIDKAVRDQLEADIAIITRESAQITVKTRGAPTEVTLDGRFAGVARSDAPLLVLAATSGGKLHQLVGRRDGHVDAEHRLEALRPGQILEVILDPVPTPTTGRVTIVSEPAGASISLGKGTRPVRTPYVVELPPGDHDVYGSLPRHERGFASFRLAAGEDRRVTVHFTELQRGWWERHRLKVFIGGAASLVVVGILLAPTINNQFAPDGVIVNYPR